LSTKADQITKNFNQNYFHWSLQDR